MEGITLPMTEEEMEADGAVWRAREATFNYESSSEEMSRFQADHFQMLLSYTDCPKVDLDATEEAWNTWDRIKQAGIMNYRDSVYRSAVTGTMSVLHHTKWLDAMDDSLESYLAHG